jgi:hypothetical protein
MGILYRTTLSRHPDEFLCRKQQTFGADNVTAAILDDIAPSVY